MKSALPAHHLLITGRHRRGRGVDRSDERGQAEVEDLELVGGREPQVGRLEVAVHHALLMRRREALGWLNGEGDVEQLVVAHKGRALRWMATR
jgi:hypothetical protein